MIATADDDGIINLYNYHSRRYDGCLMPVPHNRPQVKICKFLKGHNVLVSADLDGYINFYAIFPSTLKNTLLARVNHINMNEQIKGVDGKVNAVAFPMRAMDFNPITNILYTGDDVGYL